MFFRIQLYFNKIKNATDSWFLVCQFYLKMITYQMRVDDRQGCGHKQASDDI